ncbi:MAG: tetratricopeptide repeat protein [Myxococcota bacterium]
MRSLSCSILVLLAVLVATPAMAQQQPDSEAELEGEERADAHYQEAVGMMNRGRYREAVEEFTSALELAPSPVLYCNRGIAYIKLSEWEDALRDLKTCRDDYETNEAEMAQIDAQYQGVRAMVRALRPRAVEVARDVAAGDIEPQKVTEVQVVEDGPLLDSELAGHLATGTGAMLWSAALTLDFLSKDLREDFIAESQGGPGTSPERYSELERDLRNRKRVFVGLGIAGSALTLTGVSLLTYNWFFKDTPEAQATSSRPSLLVAPTNGGGSVGLRLAF